MAQPLKSTTTVVAGEASESDEEDSKATPPFQHISDLSNTAGELDAKAVTGKSGSATGTVVSGEASESDDEQQTTSVSSPTTSSVVVMPDGTDVRRSSSVDSSARRISDLPAYDSLLHRKLRETNAAIRSQLEGIVQRQFETSTKNLRSTSQQLAASQQLVQETSHTMRLLTNDLFQLEDKVDIVVTCSILPQVNIL